MMVLAKWLFVLRTSEHKQPFHQDYYSTSLILARSCCVRYLLRKRMCCGVTSTSSSLLMKSRACSRLIRIGGVKRTAISAVEERMFVFCFSLHTLMTISS